jgi:hypothetical protein
MAASPLRPGEDLLPVPNEARFSAAAVAEGVRSLLILLRAGTTRSLAAPHHLSASTALSCREMSRKREPFALSPEGFPLAGHFATRKSHADGQAHAQRGIAA